jgi:hypothetical protein
MLFVSPTAVLGALTADWRGDILLAIARDIARDGRGGHHPEHWRSLRVRLELGWARLRCTPHPKVNEPEGATTPCLYVHSITRVATPFKSSNSMTFPSFSDNFKRFSRSIYRAF